MQRQRLAPQERRLQIINGFITVAVKQGYQTVTREQVANELKVSPALVTRYFKDSMDILRDEVVNHAIATNNYKIVAQALAVRDPLALNASKSLREEAAALLLN